LYNNKNHYQPYWNKLDVNLLNLSKQDNTLFSYQFVKVK
jgi:hypothetical protein